MKKQLMFIAALLLTASVSQAYTQIIYDCSGGSGENAVSFNVVKHGPNLGKPNASYTAEASQSWLAGTHDSGAVAVDLVAAADGGPEYYTNKSKSFSLTVYSTSGVRDNGRAANAQVQATFVDATSKMKGLIAKRWLICK